MKYKDIAKTIKKVNNVLTKINKLFKGCSKKYKDAFKKGIESKNDFFKTNGYDSYDDFKKDFDKIEEYKKKKDIVEMAIIGKIHNYLVEINWKLAIQISRIERDVDYIYTGLKELYEGISDEDTPEKLKKRIEIICSKLVEDNKDETKNDNKLFEDLTILKSELIERGEKSIRNYIAHFHLLQNPFKDKNLKEIIDGVNEISKYRNRYKNIVYNICFEVFKKDLELNYKTLKERFRLSENTQNDDKIFEIKDLLSSKKISVLELETGKELLKKVEKLFEYKYF